MELNKSNKKSAQLDHDQQRLLVFNLGNERYAVPLLKVKEVIGKTTITPVPRTPEYFKGMMNLRGQVISVIDLRSKFSINPNETLETAIIILDLSPLAIGIIVDGIEAVVTTVAGEIMPPPSITSDIDSRYIVGVTKSKDRLILLLDIEKALSNDDIALLHSDSAETNAA